MSAPVMVTSQSEAETIAFAQQCAHTAQNGDIFTLQGTLGMGKSVFARAFIRELTGEEIDVPSPTFTLVQTYDTDKGQVWHFDLYRTEDPDEIYEIGWEEALSDGILLIEWPERLGTHLPRKRKEIIFEGITAESRKITLTQYGESN